MLHGSLGTRRDAAGSQEAKEIVLTHERFRVSSLVMDLQSARQLLDELDGPSQLLPDRPRVCNVLRDLLHAYEQTSEQARQFDKVRFDSFSCLGRSSERSCWYGHTLHDRTGRVSLRR